MIKIFINNEEVVCEDNITILEELQNPSSIELYKVFPKSWKGTNKLLTEFYFPKDYSNCEIYDDEALIFAGVVKNSNTMSLNPTKPHFCDVQVLDYKTFLSEGETLDFVISNKTVQEAIQMVVEACSEYGFVLGDVQIPNSNDVIGAYSTLEKTPYDVFQYLSEISSSIWKTRFINQHTIAIDFYDSGLIESDGTIEYTTEYFKKKQIEDITYSFSTSDYRNKQTILSDEVLSDIIQRELKIANGYDTVIQTDYKIGNIVSITVDEEPKMFATNEQKESGITADFYYSQGETTFESATNLGQGQEIIIEYISLVRGRQVFMNNDEISRINNSTNKKGIISRYENRNDVTSSEELLKIAETYIKHNSKAEIELTVITREPFLILGNSIYFDAPLNDLKDTYLVKTKKTNMIVMDNEQYYTVYEYKLSNNFNLENELNYFDNQRRKTSGNLEANDVVYRNIDIENTTNIIFNNLTITQMAAITGDNILECALDAPFNN